MINLLKQFLLIVFPILTTVCLFILIAIGNNPCIKFTKTVSFDSILNSNYNLFVYFDNHSYVDYLLYKSVFQLTCQNYCEFAEV